MAVESDRLSGKKWDKLLQSLMRGQCVLMLGPDAVRTAGSNGERMPVLEALRRHLGEELEDEGTPAPESKRLSAVAQVVVDLKGRAQLIEWVEDFYADLDIDDQSMKSIAKLPFGLIVNTVPGLDLRPSLNRYADERDGEPIASRSYDRFSSTEQLPDWSPEQPLLYNLYGSLSKPDSLVLTDSDLVDVLVSVVRGEPRLPSKLTSAFQNSNLTFVFIGFQLYHWQLRVLMHVLSEGSTKPSESFAQEVRRSELDEGARTFYRLRNKIRIVEMDASRFVSKLVAEIDSDASVELAASDVTPDSPAIFICHAHDDKFAADDLSQRLRDSGLNTWIDTHIQGGTEWNRLIENTLREEVEYVIVLQSENFKRRRNEKEAYVNKEIKIALDRQEMVGRGHRFIVPVAIDAASRDEPDHDLKHLQTVPVLDDDGFNALVKLLRRDIERTAKR